MKNFSFLFVMLFCFTVMQSQTVLHYDFSNSLSEVNGNGPDLTVLGNVGVYVDDTLNEVNSVVKKVYRFEKNSGLQFDNLAAGNFLGENYTIEIYFVFDELNSWKRVVDWKNRKTDYGAYVYNGKLNFYPYIYSQESPVFEGEYTYYVITRNAADKKLIIYTDARTQITLVDTPGDALLDEDKVLNFFHDDLIVQNEASTGAVAMIKIYDYVLDSADIQENYDDLGGNIFFIGEQAKINTSIQSFPNPASDQLVVDLSHFDTNEAIQLSLVNIVGMTVLECKVNLNHQKNVRFNTSILPNGVYLLTAESDSQTASGKVIIQR
ncbi:MAG: T9SS type A sorting domain-containing protein [Bacteroidetes bacterium]|nr:T9SS type A sorting domain-containing protein [Bacteroidota bacterium]